jgi:hypothetical protein
MAHSHLRRQLWTSRGYRPSAIPSRQHPTTTTRTSAPTPATMAPSTSGILSRTPVPAKRPRSSSPFRGAVARIADSPGPVQSGHRRAAVLPILPGGPFLCSCPRSHAACVHKTKRAVRPEAYKGDGAYGDADADSDYRLHHIPGDREHLQAHAPAVQLLLAGGARRGRQA